MATETINVAQMRKFYADRAAKLAAELDSMHEKLSALDALENDAKQLATIPTITIRKATPEELMRPVERPENENANPSLTDALYSAVQTLGDAGARASTIGRMAVSLGYQPNGDHYDVSVGTALKRLAERGRIDTKLIDGQRFYMKKK